MSELVVLCAMSARIARLEKKTTHGGLKNKLNHPRVITDPGGGDVRDASAFAGKDRRDDGGEHREKSEESHGGIIGRGCRRRDEGDGGRRERRNWPTQEAYCLLLPLAVSAWRGELTLGLVRHATGERRSNDPGSSARFVLPTLPTALPFPHPTYFN